jgi:DnaJ family protein B protein 11
LQEIVFFEEGEPLVDGEPGDLKFVVRAVASPGWERRGNDLVINHTITLVEALTGVCDALWRAPQCACV